MDSACDSLANVHHRSLSQAIPYELPLRAGSTDRSFLPSHRRCVELGPCQLLGAGSVRAVRCGAGCAGLGAPHRTAAPSSSDVSTPIAPCSPCGAGQRCWETLTATLRGGLSEEFLL